MENTEMHLPAGVELDPVAMISRFANSYQVPPESVSAIFEAGMVEFKKAGRLPLDAHLIKHYAKTSA